jgi:hypothetical protein
MTIQEQVIKIHSREDLVSFMQSLLHDLKEDPESWENNSLESFLGAMAAWIEDLDGYYEGRGESVPEQPGWKTLGEILLAAKVYE